jgi:hypothetical protein
VGEWAFDEGAGQVAHDHGPFGLDGGLGIAPGPDGADPAWVPGLAGSALRFDGGDAVVMADSAVLEPASVSIEAWVRRLGTPGAYAYVVSKGSRGCDFSSYGLYTGSSGGMASYIADVSGYTVSPAATSARVWNGAWHHVVGSFDGHSVRVYLDGAEVGDGSPTNRAIAYGLVGSAPYIGTYRGGCELGFTGDIDDVRIWSPALTPAEVAHSTPTQPSPGNGVGGGGATSMQIPPVSGRPPALAPGCVVSVPRKTLRAGRRNSLTVTVQRNERPLRNVRVLLSGKRTHSVHRTDRKGHARFVVRPRGTERRLSVRALGRICQNTSIRVRR